MAPLKTLAAIATIVAFAGPSLGANQTATTTPVLVGAPLPYALDIQRYDMGSADVPSLHSFAAGEYQGQWVLVGGLTNGLHGFTLNRNTLPTAKENRSVWVIDPVTRQTWSRSLEPTDPGSGLTESQLLSISASSAQAEQVGDTLYVVGGYGDSDPANASARDTFSTLTALDLPGLVDWAKGGAGAARDSIRQTSDPMLKVTGGGLYAVDGKMQLVFGQDYVGAYRGGLNGAYTQQVRTFTISDAGPGSGDAGLSVSLVSASTPRDEFRRRDLNVYATLSKNPDGSLEPGVTALSGVFTLSNGAWTVPVEIDRNGQPRQLDAGLDPLNAGGALDASPEVFRQGMNNYHSAKVGLFSESTGEMHELLFGGITLQEYDPANPAADALGFVTDPNLPNTNQVTSVVRAADGSYQQHLIGEFPALFADDGSRERFGSNAEFFPDPGLGLFPNGVIPLDQLASHADAQGRVRIGFIFGGLIANAPHVFGNPVGFSSASGEVFEVYLTVLVPEPSAGHLLVVAALLRMILRRNAKVFV